MPLTRGDPEALHEIGGAADDIGMVIPLAMLAILAFVVIRSLMGVVAQEEVPAPAVFAAEQAAPARAHADDAGRALLLPAAGGVDASGDATVGINAADASAS